MTGFLQVVSGIYLVVVWTILSNEVGEPTPSIAAGTAQDVADAIRIVGAIVLSIPAVAFLACAELVGDHRATPIRHETGLGGESKVTGADRLSSRHKLAEPKQVIPGMAFAPSPNRRKRMAIEDLVDDFWRDALRSNPEGPQAQAKCNAFILDLRDRVAPFPQKAQDEIFRRAANRNAECIAIARVSLDALREKLAVAET